MPEPSWGIVGGNVESASEPNRSSAAEGQNPIDRGNPTTAFQCSVCGFSVAQCKFGRLEFDLISYTHPVYYMRDPFEPPNVHKHPSSYSVDDFVMLGANCHLCEQPSCADEECSLHYGKWFCTRCVMRERHSFPIEVVKNVEKRLNAQKDKVTDGAKAEEEKKTTSTTG